MRITKKVFGAMAVLSLTMLFSPLQAIVGQAAAWDSEYAFKYNGNGGNVSTGYRYKEDDTSFYVFHKGDVNAFVNLMDEYNRNCSINKYFKVESGREYFLYNDAFENYGLVPGKDTIRVRLLLSPEPHTPSYLHGLWSPDSV